MCLRLAVLTATCSGQAVLASLPAGATLAESLDAFNNGLIASSSPVGKRRCQYCLLLLLGQRVEAAFIRCDDLSLSAHLLSTLQVTCTLSKTLLDQLETVATEFSTRSLS